MQPLPADKRTLVYFAAALSRSLSTPTIKVYLSAVGSFHRRQGFKDPTHPQSPTEDGLAGHTTS